MCTLTTLLTLGHVNHVVRRAIEEGTPPVVAIQMATINAAECFGMSYDLGSITPGKFADILFIRDLADPRPEKVMADGEIVSENGRMLVEFPPKTYPEYAPNQCGWHGLWPPMIFASRPASLQECSCQSYTGYRRPGC